MDHVNSSTDGAFKSVSHVIFDMDGLLLDTETIYTQAIQNIIAPYGKIYTWETKVTMMGLTGWDGAKVLVDTYQLPISYEDYHEKLQEQYRLLFPNSELMPGADKLVRHLHSNNVPIAVATSSIEDSVTIKTRNHRELFSLFRHIVCGTSDPEVKRGKPEPDIFLICAERFPDKPKPEQCLVFEDSPNGVLAAKRAGMQCIMVPDERMDPELTKEATAVLKSLEDIKLEDFGLPPLN